MDGTSDFAEVNLECRYGSFQRSDHKFVLMAMERSHCWCELMCVMLHSQDNRKEETGVIASKYQNAEKTSRLSSLV